ncbi:MAG: hypothetical protein WC815_13615 [Vicinamibacterales bacterium]|jgi:hypothetical protein
MKRIVASVVPVALITLTVACGGGAPASAPAPVAAPAPAAAPAEAPKPAATLSLLEPIEGASGGHIDIFRWSAVDGADGYVVKIQANSDGRVVWESPVLTATEAKLPTTVALEPEAHTWQVSARKAGQVLVASAPQKFTITP